MDTPPIALYVQIKEALRGEIVNGKLKPHDQLPSESELTERFSVSRITVRQALNDLQKDGLIFKLHGKGSYVSKPKAHQSLDRLQGFAEAMSGGGNEIFNEVLSAMERPAEPAVAARLNLSAGEPVFEIKRLRFLNRSPISVDITYVPTSVGARLAKADLATRDIFLILENDFGLALGNAEVSIEAVAADEELARLLRTRRRAPLLRIERLTFTRDKTPLDFEYLFYIGDQFRYRLNVERRS